MDVKSLFVGVKKHFYNHEQILDCGEGPWFWKTFLIKEISLLVEKSLLVENFLLRNKPFLMKNVLDQEKILACVKVLWFKKTTGLSLLKMKLYNKIDTSVETIKVYIAKSEAKLLTFYLHKFFSIRQNQYQFCFV